MLMQLFVCAVLVYVPVAAYLLWRKGRETGPSPETQERLAQYTLRTTARTGNVTAAPVDPPLASVTPMWPRAVRDDESDMMVAAECFLDGCRLERHPFGEPRDAA